MTELLMENPLLLELLQLDTQQIDIFLVTNKFFYSVLSDDEIFCYG